MPFCASHPIPSWTKSWISFQRLALKIRTLLNCTTFLRAPFGNYKGTQVEEKNNIEGSEVRTHTWERRLRIDSRTTWRPNVAITDAKTKIPCSTDHSLCWEKTNLYDEKQVLVEWAAFYDLTQSFCSFEGESNTNCTTTFHTKEASGIFFCYTHKVINKMSADSKGKHSSICCCLSGIASSRIFDNFSKFKWFKSTWSDWEMIQYIVKS